MAVGFLFPFGDFAGAEVGVFKAVHIADDIAETTHHPGSASVVAGKGFHGEGDGDIVFKEHIGGIVVGLVVVGTVYALAVIAVF